MANKRKCGVVVCDHFVHFCKQKCGVLFPSEKAANFFLKGKNAERGIFGPEKNPWIFLV